MKNSSDSLTKEKTSNLKRFKNYFATAGISSLMALVGCQSAPSTESGLRGPRLIPSPYFGSISGIECLDATDIGPHCYDGGCGEHIGLVYTARGGFIDTGHVKEPANRTRYFSQIALENIMKNNAEFNFKSIEPGEYLVKIKYPSDFATNPDKEKILKEVAIDLGQNFAHMSTCWHETITWFGYSSILIASEKPSSFSPEDAYSDLLGIRIAGKVLREGGDYDAGVAKEIASEVQRLGGMSAAKTREALKKAEGTWFNGRYPFITMHKRNFGEGFEDGYITPFRIPGMSDEPEERLAVPKMDALHKYGFEYELYLKPASGQKYNIEQIIQLKDGQYIEPKKDFPKIIEAIRARAKIEEGQNVDNQNITIK